METAIGNSGRWNNEFYTKFWGALWGVFGIPENKEFYRIIEF